jgi:ParB-like chromosome segregation protein Spo0J
MIKLPVAFVPRVLAVQVDELLPTKRPPEKLDYSPKFRTIQASILEVGLIEPLSVSSANTQGKRMLLDGHVRLEIVRNLGWETVSCIEATDEETFTYNGRVNRLSTIQEHYMLRRAIEKGVSPERLAKALNVNIQHLKRKMGLLNGICPAAAELLKDRQFSAELAGILRKLKPARQTECVEMMVAANSFTVAYAKGLLFTTSESELVAGRRPSVGKLVTAQQIERMSQESANLQDRYRLVEKDYGQTMLQLTVVCAYVSKLISNEEVTRYLKKRHAEVLNQLESISASTSIQG